MKKGDVVMFDTNDPASLYGLHKLNGARIPVLYNGPAEHGPGGSSFITLKLKIGGHTDDYMMHVWDRYLTEIAPHRKRAGSIPSLVVTIPN